MSVAVDANLLLYASDRDSAYHEGARSYLEKLVAGPDLVYLFWPVAMAYLRIATHPSIFAAPLSAREAMGNLEGLLARPRVRSPGETEEFWPVFSSVASGAQARGNLVTDAHLVGLMRLHGVTTIASRDRDFRKFDGIRAIDPFA